MTKTLKKEKVVEEKKVDNKLAKLIEENVLKNLGEPKNFNRISAIHLWHNYYRVNIWISKSEFSISISDSFFIEATEDGIIRCNPELIRKY